MFESCEQVKKAMTHIAKGKGKGITSHRSELLTKVHMEHGLNLSYLVKGFGDEL